MSGQQIGSVIGGIIGFYFGGPAGAQWGMAIGGAIGGAIDPTKINGPHIGDGQQQTTTDGSPIAWILGTGKIAGTVVWAGPRKEVKIKDSGGKGGPVVSHYESRQSFAILVCESSELKGSTIDSVLMVEQDGKLVYDVRSGSTIASDSAKWAKNVTFYYGAEDQLPPPLIEADKGVGNTPAYRGVLLAVFEDFNIYAAGDRIPQFKFAVQSEAVLEEYKADSVPWRYKYMDADEYGIDLSGADVDDSDWLTAGTDTLSNTGTKKSIWIRQNFDAPDWPLEARFSHDDAGYLWVNGQSIFSNVNYAWGETADIVAISLPPPGLITARSVDSYPIGSPSVSGIRVSLWTRRSTPSLQSIVESICKRGGLTLDGIDATALADTDVRGYPIARQCTGTDALTPLLQAYFAYGTDYDGKLRFKFYGEDASVTVSRDDLIEGNDANEGAITENTRNQATEFPRKIIASYMDPDQNYEVVTVPAERGSTTVIAIGERQLAIPVVMSADDAAKAVNKAMKVAYATLEGTRDYCVPFARSATYLTVCAGEPVLMDGKRWVVDQIDVSSGYLKFSTRYDRQSAYTSTVQAITGNAPRAPTSRYSGPTTLVPMNLPSLRPQDTYGVYLAAKGTQSSWRGCNVLVSYDGQQSWQSALTMTIGSTIGTLAAEIPSGGEPLTVDVGDDQLESVTDEQIAARMNAFALIDADDNAEIGQFHTADLQSNGDYELTDVSRELLGTTEGAYAAGDPFVMLDSVYFLPIDIAFKGQTIYFRAVGFNEAAEDQPIVSLVYEPDTTIIHDGGTVA